MHRIHASLPYPAVASKGMLSLYREGLLALLVKAESATSPGGSWVCIGFVRPERETRQAGDRGRDSDAVSPHIPACRTEHWASGCPRVRETLLCCPSFPPSMVIRRCSGRRRGRWVRWARD